MGVVLATGVVAFVIMSNRSRENADWTFDFGVDPGELAPTGHNPFFILEPGYTLVLEDSTTRVTITVLDETRVIDGVRTRAVEERELSNGTPVRVSRRYFAISTRTNSVYRFGAAVDNYIDGEIANHEGSWAAGADGARFGLAMPGLPLLRARFYQEMATGTAMDRAEILAVRDTLPGPVGILRGLLRMAVSSPLEPGVVRPQYYGRGIGLVRDGSRHLVSNGIAE